MATLTPPARPRDPVAASKVSAGHAAEVVGLVAGIGSIKFELHSAGFKPASLCRIDTVAGTPSSRGDALSRFVGPTARRVLPWGAWAVVA